MAFKSSLDKKRFENNFDFLRLFAALCITFTHSFGLLGLISEDPLALITGKYHFAFIGLSIFFCISGFLITKSTTTSRNIVNFAWKRFLRIQPLLIVVTLLSIFLIGPLFTQLDIKSYFTQPATWSYLRNIFPPTGIQYPLPGVFDGNTEQNSVNGSLWTLVLEERFYIVSMIVFFFSIQRRRFFYLFFVALYNVFCFTNAFLWHFSDMGIFQGIIAFYALLFFNSGLLYHLGIDFNKTKKGLLLILSAIFLILSAQSPDRSLLMVCIIPVFIVQLAHLKGALNKTAIYGDFTYGIYIFSFPVQQCIIALTGGRINPYPLFFMTILITLPLAILSWHLLEKKMLMLKERFGRSKIQDQASLSR